MQLLVLRSRLHILYLFHIKVPDFLGLLADLSIKLLHKILHGLHLCHIILILLIIHNPLRIFAGLPLEGVLKLHGAVLELDDLLHDLLLIVALAGSEDVLAGLAGLGWGGAGLDLGGFGVGVAAAVGYAHVFGD